MAALPTLERHKVLELPLARSFSRVPAFQLKRERDLACLKKHIPSSTVSASNNYRSVAIFIWVMVRLFLQRRTESQEKRVHNPRNEGAAYTGVRDALSQASSEVPFQYAHEAPLDGERRGET